MEDDNINGPLDELAAYLREKDRNFSSSNERSEFCTCDTLVEDVSLHVMFPEALQNQITWRKFPPDPFIIPNLSFDKEGEHERHRDFLFSNISADGLLLSAKGKAVFQQFDLGEHRFYPVNIIHKKGRLFKQAEKFEFYWLHLIIDETQKNYVDFKRSHFQDQVRLQGKLLQEIELTFDSLGEWEAYRIEKYEAWRSGPGIVPHHTLRPLSIKLLMDMRIPDLFGLGKIDSGTLYITRRLAEAIGASGLKGLRIKGTKMVGLQ